MPGPEYVWVNWKAPPGSAIVKSFCAEKFNASNEEVTAAGTAGDLAGTVTSQGALTVTAGGAGTTATGQFVTELQIN